MHELTERCAADAEFASTLRSDPSEALKTYELSESAREAIESGNEERIRAALDCEYERGVPNQ